MKKFVKNKTWNKKYFLIYIKNAQKFIILGLSFFIIFLGIVLGFAFKEDPILTAQGSTTVLPLFESLSQGYYKSEKGKITVGPGGSTVGLKLIQQSNLVDFGNASRWPKLNDNEYNSSIWAKNLSTVTLGYDVIVFALNFAGTGFAVNKESTMPFYLTPLQISGLYSGKTSNISHMLKNSPGLVGSTNDSRSTIICREVGSGTRDSFFNALDAYFPNQGSSQDAFIKNHISNTLVLNSNGLVSQTLLSTPNSFGFVSLETLDMFKNNSNIKLCPIFLKDSNNPSDKGTILDPNVPEFKHRIYSESINVPQNGDKIYRFWHPMNTVFNVNDKKIKEIDKFFNWFFLPNQFSKIDQDGYIPLLGYHQTLDNKYVPKIISNKENILSLIEATDSRKYSVKDVTTNSSNYHDGQPWWTWNINVEWLSGEKKISFFDFHNFLKGSW